MTNGTAPADEVVDAVVIGSGFSGLYMLYSLRERLGMDVVVLESASDIGGTWHHNRYPGARCDTESYIYCYSFSPEILAEWQWSGRYPEQAEIHRYLAFVADRLDLRRDIQLNSRVERATWSEADGRWTVEVAGGRVFSARFLITGIGPLSAGHVPSVKGLETFKGEWFHTADWPTDGVDFSGKRVGVIGTGSTGVQLVPVVAEQAAEVVVFQRTPQFAIPARHERVDRNYIDAIMRNYEEVRDVAKWSAAGFPWHSLGESALDATAEERLEKYESLWEEGGFRFLYGTYKDVYLDRLANDTASEFIRQKIRETVADPVVAEAITPVDHPFGSRRPIVETNYYASFNSPHVHLADIRTFPLVEVTPDGIRTTQQHYELDVIIFATGFDAVTGSFTKIDIRGRDNVALAEKWSEGPVAYLGLSVHDFPNLFMVMGPGSTFGNAPVVIEHHVEWITELIAFMDRESLAQVEATTAAELEWKQTVHDSGERSLVSLAESWFTGANIPGKTRAYFFYPGSLRSYRRKAEQIAALGYVGFESQGRSLGPALASARQQ
jgi:cation diffusion facilitator CzcD-associated flavoprotein CzcO